MWGDIRVGRREGRDSERVGGYRVTHVLIVDDDEAIRETLRFTLEDAGYTVEEERDGLAALQRLRQSQVPMVVLLDLMMPGLDGAGVLGAIAGDGKLLKRYAFVLITASNRTLTLAFANLLSSLSVPVINKPWDVELLLKAVASAARRIDGIDDSDSDPVLTG